MTLIQPHPDAAQVQQHMQRWLERAVIGLNLGPFAKAVHVKGQIRYAVTAATDAGELLAELRQELLDLAQADPAERDTMAYRDSAEADLWLERDPIPRQIQRLVSAGVLTTEDVTSMESDVKAMVDEALVQASAAPFPNPQQAWEDVYA